jgi:hypothetical protein
VEEGNRDKDRYINEVKNLPYANYKNKKWKRKRDKRVPKRILTPYMFFVKEVC